MSASVQVFCSTSLLLASKRWVWLIFSSQWSLSSKQHHWLTAATSTIFLNAWNPMWGSKVQKKYANNTRLQAYLTKVVDSLSDDVPIWPLFKISWNNWATHFWGAVPINIFLSFGPSPGPFIYWSSGVFATRAAKVINNNSSHTWIRHWGKNTDESGSYLKDISWVKNFAGPKIRTRDLSTQFCSCQLPFLYLLLSDALRWPLTSSQYPGEPTNYFERNQSFPRACTSSNSRCACFTHSPAQPGPPMKLLQGRRSPSLLFHSSSLHRSLYYPG